jgi:hypothetical protein
MSMIANEWRKCVQRARRDKKRYRFYTAIACRRRRRGGGAPLSLCGKNCSTGLGLLGLLKVITCHDKAAQKRYWAVQAGPCLRSLGRTGCRRCPYANLLPWQGASANTHKHVHLDRPGTDWLTGGRGLAAVVQLSPPWKVQPAKCSSRSSASLPQPP